MMKNQLVARIGGNSSISRIALEVVVKEFNGSPQSAPKTVRQRLTELLFIDIGNNLTCSRFISKEIL
jgi:hypothetical protein